VYHNNKGEGSPLPEKNSTLPHPKRRWELNKEDFLCGLIVCAGRRHALGVDDSCCQSSRKGRPRQSSFSNWDIVHDESTESESSTTSAGSKRKGPTSAAMSKRGLLKIDDFANALRPMINLFAILDYISLAYVPKRRSVGQARGGLPESQRNSRPIAEGWCETGQRSHH
jgi:hypothetical protein